MVGEPPKFYHPGRFHPGPWQAMDPSGVVGALLTAFSLSVTLGLFVGPGIRRLIFPGMLLSFAIIIALYVGSALLEDMKEAAEERGTAEEVDAAISELEAQRGGPRGSDGCSGARARAPSYGPHVRG